MKFKKTLITAVAALSVFAFSSNDVEAAEKNILYNLPSTTGELLYTDGKLSPASTGLPVYILDYPVYIHSVAMNANPSRDGYSKFILTDVNDEEHTFEIINDTDRINTFSVPVPSILTKKIQFISGGATTELYAYYDDTKVPDFIAPSAITNLSYVLGEDNSIKFSFTNPLDEDFSHVQVYKDDEILTNNLTETILNVTDLIPEETYVFTFYAVDKAGNKSLVTTSTVTMPAGADLIAPLDIKDLKHVARDTSIQFTYDLPIDPDFSHLMIYRNNTLVGDNVKIASFNDLDLDYDTSYQYVFKSVDTSGNVSNGYTMTVKTMPYNDTIPPDAVTGLSLNEGNSSLYASWSPNVEPDVQGYNVYVNGKKRNSSLITGNSYSITNLDNGTEYLIQVSAVDTNGNESDLSDIKSASPDKNVLPVIKLDNDLTSVGSSVENWFSEIWLITAFAIGLPLAFIVGNRVKSLFFA